MTTPTYLKAGEVAAICGVDLKTIHNWVDRRSMPHFRTPGRHLRFKHEEVVPWLISFGYTMPPHLQQYVPTGEKLGSMQGKGAA